MKINFIIPTIFTSIIIALVCGIFYWFEYRPSVIREECAKMVFLQKDISVSNAEVLLKVCLYKYGIKE